MKASYLILFLPLTSGFISGVFGNNLSLYLGISFIVDIIFLFAFILMALIVALNERQGINFSEQILLSYPL
ncbi:MAG: hypothetical protein QW314_05350 [Thermoproteota archaeon]|nr:hypothetical protein [Candidatus Brockarchaeota archaeon]